MTDFQRVFIQNLRFLRSEKKLSQVKFSELVDVTPNYLNAIENGKNFPSLEVLQRMIDALGVLPYQLFLEYPGGSKIESNNEKKILVQELTHLKQHFLQEFDKVIKNIESE